LLTGIKIERFAISTVFSELREDVSDEACQEIARALEADIYRVARRRYRDDLAALGVDVTDLKVPPPASRR
jgi:hypothetical protein